MTRLHMIPFLSLTFIDLINSLPYTEAVLMEAQRLSSIAPFTVPHTAMKDTQLQGYTIPKVSLFSIIINIHQILHLLIFWNFLCHKSGQPSDGKSLLCAP